MNAIGIENRLMGHQCVWQTPFPGIKSINHFVNGLLSKKSSK